MFPACRLLGCLGGAALLLLARPASSQGVMLGTPDKPAGGSVPEDTWTVIIEHDREWIHPGNQLELVGREQGDNDFRSATPALLHGKLETAQVDIDELRERKLAMYTEGQRFDASPRKDVYLSDRIAELKRELRSEEEAPKDDSFPWTLPLGAAALGLVALKAWRS